MKAGARFHDEIIDTWKTKDSRDFAYYAAFETPERLDIFWGEGSRFRRAFEAYLDLSRVLEIASGTGRHAAQIVDRCGQIALLDTSVEATKIAKERFSTSSNVEVVLSDDGVSLPFLDNDFSAVFSYDAMVHFEPLAIASYISDIARVLKPGGRALLHHSNYRRNPTGKFTDNPAWRNYMPEGFVVHLASRSGLTVLEQQCFKWEKKGLFQPRSDALTVLERPR